jgi:hypothetical protein
MVEVVNLNRARKSKAKTAAKAGAAENRVKFGRTKAETSLDAARADKAARALDQARRED